MTKTRSHQAAPTNTKSVRLPDPIASSTQEPSDFLADIAPSSSARSSAQSGSITVIETFEEISEPEAAERHRLELKVERAFYEAGRALRELRDRRLYRSTHRTFAEYCRDRFGFERRHSYRLIEAAGVLDNLCPNWTQTAKATHGTQIIPTKESQVRALTSLPPDEQRQVWSMAVEEAGGKVPSARTVKQVAERLKPHSIQPPIAEFDAPAGWSGGDRVTVSHDHPLFPGRSGTIVQLPNRDLAIVKFDTEERELIYLKDLKPALALHLKLLVGSLVEVKAPARPQIDGRRGRIAAVAERTVEVWLRDLETMMMHQHTLKHQQVEPIPVGEEPQLDRVCQRLERLSQCHLDPFEREILSLYDRPVALTPIELEYLATIEQRHGINHGDL